MFSIIKSATILGVTAVPIYVEVDASNGLPQETIVGLPDTVVKESKTEFEPLSNIRDLTIHYDITPST